ncbi:hypothetical protein SGL43_03834 [Streptomyces globisporus]|uniref:Uncharacterized protein n=1 Tax=Streptomyces globisporus TaxID=1908 RepID=A0ABN8V5H8_STRGL|nr:hypothetical protein SGL43_03834 [Streptomyces globisporus]
MTLRTRSVSEALQETHHIPVEDAPGGPMILPERNRGVRRRL